VGKDRFLRITGPARRARNLGGDNQPVIESLRRVRGDLSAPLAHHRKATEGPRRIATRGRRYASGTNSPHEFRLLGYDFDSKCACGGFWPAGTASPPIRIQACSKESFEHRSRDAEPEGTLRVNLDSALKPNMVRDVGIKSTTTRVGHPKLVASPLTGKQVVNYCRVALAITETIHRLEPLMMALCVWPVRGAMGQLFDKWY
jgi:hypothetical protein